LSFGFAVAGGSSGFAFTSGVLAALGLIRNRLFCSTKHQAIKYNFRILFQKGGYSFFGLLRAVVDP